MNGAGESTGCVRKGSREEGNAWPARREHLQEAACRPRPVRGADMHGLGRGNARIGQMLSHRAASPSSRRCSIRVGPEPNLCLPRPRSSARPQMSSGRSRSTAVNLSGPMGGRHRPREAVSQGGCGRLMDRLELRGR